MNWVRLKKKKIDQLITHNWVTTILPLDAVIDLIWLPNYSMCNLMIIADYLNY